MGILFNPFTGKLQYVTGNMSCSGLTGRIPKFNGARSLTSSVMSELSGKIGINTVGPTDLLHVFGTNPSEGARITTAYVGESVASGFTQFSNYGFKNDITGYALLQHTTGETFVNSKAGYPTNIRENNGQIVAFRNNAALPSMRITNINNAAPTIDLKGVYNNSRIPTMRYTLGSSTPEYTTGMSTGLSVPNHLYSVWGSSNGDSWPGALLTTVDLNGNMWISGLLTQASDKRLKEDIKPLENSLGKILKLKGKSYRWKDKPLEDGDSHGLIAQEVKEVFPELVKENNEGMLSVSYNGLIPSLIESIKAQQEQIEALKNEIDLMKGVV